jgi:glycosyltransferase involved in cell wall biosynthesis
LVKTTIKIIDNGDYSACIGIEKKGLIWAAQIAQKLHVPYLYHSLELYTAEHPEVRKSANARILKNVEKIYHKNAYATIIQDERRGEILLRDNGVKNERKLFVPISMLGPAYRKRSRYFQAKLCLPDDTSVILNFGLIWKERLCFEVTKIAQNFPNNWVLVFHGHEEDGEIKKIRSIDRKNKVIISSQFVDESRIQEVVSSAHIALVLYKSNLQNDILTAFSSEKLALCLQCGLPIIAFNYPGYEILTEYKCGALIKKIEELIPAIQKIMNSYDEYRQNAFKCFEAKYEYSHNYHKVVETINQLA